MKILPLLFATLVIVVFSNEDKGCQEKETVIIKKGKERLRCKEGVWEHQVKKKKKWIPASKKRASPGGAPCMDAAKATCSADRGHCNQYTEMGEEMERICPGTCESCDGCRCQDNKQWHKYCPYWAKYCDSPGVLGNWMTTNCRKTCGKCRCKCCSYKGQQHQLGARIPIPEKCGELVCEESLIAAPSPLLPGARSHAVSHPEELTLNFHAVHDGADCCILPGDAVGGDGSNSLNGSMVAEGWSGLLSIDRGTFSTTCCHGVLSVPLNDANPISTTTDQATTTTPKFVTLPQCKIESLSFALDISGSMNGASMSIWKPAAVNLVEEMFRRQVTIDRHYLFTYVDTIQAALTTTSHQNFSDTINNWNSFRGSRELTFAALKHAMEQVNRNAFVCVWTDEIGDDTNNSTLKQQILSLKTQTNSEIFFMVITKPDTQTTKPSSRNSRDSEDNDDKNMKRGNLNLAAFKAKFDDIGHVMDITNDRNVLVKIIEIMKKAALCNEISTPIIA